MGSNRNCPEAQRTRRHREPCSAVCSYSLKLLEPNSRIVLYSNGMGLESSAAPGRTAARLARQVELALAEVGLSLPQYRILIHLDEGKVAASTLADKLAVSRPSITAVVDGLVTRGLVERQHEPGDRRRVGHDLTADGRRLLERADESVDRRLSEIASVVKKEKGAVKGTSSAKPDDPMKSLERWKSALDAYRDAKHADRQKMGVVRSK